MTSRTQLSALILLTTAAWVITLLIEGVPVSAGWLGSFGVVQLAVTGGVFVFDRWLWKFRPLPRLLGRPVIHGTWRGRVTSSWRPEPLDGFLVIRQTFTDVSINLITANGRSHTLACRWRNTDSGEPGVFHIYQLVPSRFARDADPVRYGGCVLEICGNPAQELRGPYWTDGSTYGELSFTAHTRHVCSDYGTAQRAEYNEKSR
jgi:hypothetical protein